MGMLIYGMRWQQSVSDYAAHRIKYRTVSRMHIVYQVQILYRGKSRL